MSGVDSQVKTPVRPSVVEIGNATLHHADCRDIIPFLSGIGLVITSPPYNLGGAPWARLGNWKPGNPAGSGGNAKWRSGATGSGVSYANHNDAMGWREYVEWQQSTLSQIWAHLSDDGAIFYNHKPRVIGTRLWSPTELIPPEIEIRQIITWARPGGMNYNLNAFVPTSEWVMLLAKPAFRLRTRGVSGLGDVWRIRPDTGNPHPAPFPLALPSKVIEATKPEGLVFDPFMGSGTTAIAALRAGRRFVGVEIDARYFDMACARIEADLFRGVA